MKSKDVCFVEGWHAHKKGLSLLDNPYYKGNHRKWWFEGFYDRDRDILMRTTKAYRAGWIAFHNLIKLDRNPYGIGSEIDYYDWRLGWLDAKKRWTISAAPNREAPNGKD